MRAQIDQPASVAAPRSELGGEQSVAARERLLFAIAFIWLAIPATNRSYFYDESVTVYSFIEVDSVKSVFTEQVVFNNHIGMSFLSHILFRLGIGDQLTYRMVAVTFAAAAVTLTYRIGRRWYGEAVGLWAAAILSLLPLFREQAFQVRGYAAITFLILLASSHLARHIEQPRTRPLSKGYFIAVAAAVCFNLYSMVPFAVHGLLILIRRPKAWLDNAVRLCIASLCGLITYVAVLGRMRAVSSSRPGEFRPSLPIEVARELLGVAPWLAGIMAVCVVVGLRVQLRSASIGWALGGCAAAFGCIWIVLAPRDVYPRMWVWLLPGVALAAAVGVMRTPVLRFGLGIALAITGLTGARDAAFGGDRSAEQFGAFLEAVSLEGNQVCAVLHTYEPVLVYTQTESSHLRSVLSGCDVVYALPYLDEDFYAVGLERTFAAGSKGEVNFLIGWSEEAGRRSPTLARIERSGQASSSWFDS